MEVDFPGRPHYTSPQYTSTLYTALMGVAKLVGRRLPWWYKVICSARRYDSYVHILGRDFFTMFQIVYSSIEVRGY